MNCKALLITIITLTILSQSYFIYAASPLEGFNILKINKNLDDCLKNSELQKGVLQNSHSANRHNNGIYWTRYMYNILGTNTVELYKNFYENLELLNYIDRGEFESKYKNISEYNISKKTRDDIYVGTVRVSELNCYTYKDIIFAIDLEFYCSGTELEGIRNLLKKKYGEPAIDDYIWYNEPILLSATSSGLKFININTLSELLEQMVEPLNKKIKDINQQKNIQKEQQDKKALEDL